MRKTFKQDALFYVYSNLKKLINFTMKKDDAYNN